MSKQQELNSNFKFAQTNGYQGSFVQYMEANYKSYASVCNRCDIKPMSLTEWANS